MAKILKEDKSIVQYESQEINKYLEEFSYILSSYLKSKNLPSENVLVDFQQRGIVFSNLPTILSYLDDNQANNAFYISKFIAACASGLFDAALNYLWNETILNLKEKVKQFDVNYFYNIIINNPQIRTKFKNESDLEKLQDWQIIDGCHKMGIISNIGYKQLTYIRDMRNYASAAHPNNINLTGFQLLDWLETCIREVLAKSPSEPAINIKKLLNNLRTQEIDSKDFQPIKDAIHNITDNLLINTLLKALFGLYMDINLPQFVKKNIEQIITDVWINADVNVKNEIGYKYGIYSVNGDIEQKKLTKKFLEIVDGLKYLSEDQLVIEIREKCENLLNVHFELNNFYNEPPHAKDLKKYISNTGKIPENARYIYVKTIIICKLGNMFGISWAAQPIYDELINLFTDDEIKVFLELLNDNTFKNEFYYKKMGPIYKELALKLKNKTNNQILKNALDRVLKTLNKDLISQNLWHQIKNLLKYI